MFTKKTLWVLTTTVVTLVLLYGLSVHKWDPRALAEDEWQQTPYWVWALVVLAASAATWLGNKRKLLSIIAAAALIFFIIVVYTSYRDGWLMTGHWREIFYVLAGAFAVIAYTYASTDKEKTVSAAVLGAIFIMLGCSQVFTWGQFSPWLPWYWGGGSDARQMIASAPPVMQVPVGIRLSARLGPTPVELNPGGRYKIWVHELNPSQCVNVYGPRNQYIGNDCNGSVDLHDTAKFASATGNVVAVEYILSSP